MARRIALGAAVAAVLVGLIVLMSGRAPRLAGSDHMSPDVFAAFVPAGGTLCQPTVALPGDAARAVLTVGSYGKPLPQLSLTFLSPGGRVTASGQLGAGHHEGIVSIPLRHTGPGLSQRLCIAVGGSRVALAGFSEVAGPSSESINGTPAGGAVSLLYYRAGRESWWSLLGALSRRFAWGKAAPLGTATFALCALALIGVWVAVVRLLLREDEVA